MKVDYSNGRFIITLPSKERVQERKSILSDLMLRFTKWIDSDTAVFEPSNEEDLLKSSKSLEICANIHGADISPNALKIFEECTKKRFEIEQERAMEETQRKARETALLKLKKGCGFCDSLKWDGKRYMCEEQNKPCRQSSAEFELNWELWKESGYREFNRCTPFPVKECRYLEAIKYVQKV